MLIHVEAALASNDDVFQTSSDFREGRGDLGFRRLEITELTSRFSHLDIEYV